MLSMSRSRCSRRRYVERSAAAPDVVWHWGVGGVDGFRSDCAVHNHCRTCRRCLRYRR